MTSAQPPQATTASSKSPVPPALPPGLAWPRWTYNANKWLTFIQTALAALAIVAPEFMGTTVPLINRAVAFAVIVGAPVAVTTLLWLLQLALIACRRVYFYSRLFLAASIANAERIQLEETLRNERIQFEETLRNEHIRFIGFIELLEARYRFEIINILFQNDRIFIVLRKKRSPRLEIGDRLAVYRREDDYSEFIGIFEVIEDRRGGYYAKAAELAAILWPSYMKEHGLSEMISPPYIVAVLLPGGDSDVQETAGR